MNLFNQVFNTWKKEDHDTQIIRLQRNFIYILCAIALLAFIGWMYAPSKLTIYIPPDISNGVTQKVNEIPKAFIYSFTYELFQEINHWANEGTIDYPVNIRTYSSYLTPKFRAELLQEFEELKISSQVQRQRNMQGIAGAAYDATSVKKLSEGTWQVDLKVRLMEFKNNQLVKDVEILYPLKVTRWDVSQVANPYGLALAGFASEPVRLKTYI